jgi:hypothetical protein
MDTIKFRRTVALVASAALITSLTVAAFGAPAAAKPGDQRLDAQQARAEARAEAKSAREAAKQTRAEARAEAKSAREAAKQARAETRAEAKAARDAAKQAKAGKIMICHKPGSPAEGTLEISTSALQAHLDHGDVEAACGPAAPVTLTICEEPGTDEETSTAAGTDEDDGVACDEAPQVVVSIDAPESIEPQDALQLQGVISGPEASDLSYVWSSTCLTDGELTDPTIIAGDPDTALLIIREDILTAGTTCDFTLTVADETSGADGSATVTVEVVLLP